MIAKGEIGQQEITMIFTGLGILGIRQAVD